MNSNLFTKKARMITMMISMVCIPVMLILISLNKRSYGAYMGNFYELNYWWETLVLMIGVTCLVCRFFRKSEHIETIIKIIAAAATIVLIFVILKYSGWGVVRLLDSLGNGDDGVFLVWMTPIPILLVGYGYATLGKFVANV